MSDELHKDRDFTLFEKTKIKAINRYELERDAAKRKGDKEDMKYWQDKIDRAKEWKIEDFPEQEQKEFKQHDSKPPSRQILPGTEGVAEAVKKRKKNMSITELRRRKNVRKDVKS